jgi:Outer membrane protein beta-barrel domain
MNEKNNIDRLFREKFKDFEVAPPEFIWENIEETLREKKKRRVIPLWIRLSGVAAVLVIGSFFMMPYFIGGTDANDSPVVIDKNGGKRMLPVEHPVPNKGTIIIGDSTKVNGIQNSAVASGVDKPGTGAPGTNGGKASGNDLKNDAKYSNRALDNAANAVADGGKSGTTPTPKGNNSDRRRGKKTGHIVPGHITQAVADAARQRNRSGKNASNTNSPDSRNNKGQDIPANKNAIAAGSEKDPAPQGPQDASAPNKTGQETGIIKNDIPKEQGIAEAAVDTASMPQPENPLEKLRLDMLKDKKEEDKAVAENSDKGKWNIKPQVAPVFYNSLSGGSPIDGQFAGNSKSFDNDLSYGVGIDYAVNDRLSVRSGVNTVNLSYATNDIQFRPSLSGGTNNVSARSKAAHIVVQNADATVPVTPDGFTALAGFSNEQTFNGAMVQKTGYIEVPVELSYSLVKKKFGIDLIGGVSTLFLNENNVSVVSNQGYSAQVGEAQNLNSIHFSTNVGLGFKYRFWKSFQANFEPMFKYQVNAYSRDAGNFKPYFIGLYSGISFSF